MDGWTDGVMTEAGQLWY